MPNRLTHITQIYVWKALKQSKKPENTILCILPNVSRWVPLMTEQKSPEKLTVYVYVDFTVDSSFLVCGWNYWVSLFIWQLFYYSIFFSNCGNVCHAL